MGAVLEVLVSRVGVNGGHQALFDAKGVVEDFRHGGETVGGARRIRHDVVGCGVVILMVDAHDDRNVFTVGWRRNDDLFCSCAEVILRLVSVSEESSGLDHNVNIKLSPRQVGRVALGIDGDGFAIDDDGAFSSLHGDWQTAADRVIFEQVSQSLGVGKVIHCDDGDVVRTGQCCTEKASSNTAKTIDGYVNH